MYRIKAKKEWARTRTWKVWAGNCHPCFLTITFSLRRSRLLTFSLNPKSHALHRQLCVKIPTFLLSMPWKSTLPKWVQLNKPKSRRRNCRKRVPKKNPFPHFSQDQVNRIYPTRDLHKSPRQKYKTTGDQSFVRFEWADARKIKWKQTKATARGSWGEGTVTLCVCVCGFGFGPKKRNEVGKVQSSHFPYIYSLLLIKERSF